MHLDDSLDEEQAHTRVVVTNHRIENALLGSLRDTHTIIRDTDGARGRGLIDKHLYLTVGWREQGTVAQNHLNGLSHLVVIEVDSEVVGQREE